MLPRAVYKNITQTVGCSHHKMFLGHILKIRFSTRDDDMTRHDLTWPPKIGIPSPTDADFCPRKTEFRFAPLQLLRNSHIKNASHSESYQSCNLLKESLDDTASPWVHSCLYAKRNWHDRHFGDDCCRIRHTSIILMFGKRSAFCNLINGWWNLKLNVLFSVCQSVHHHTFNWINQQDAATAQVYYLPFRYSSTCFGHPHAHHQELQQLQWQPLVLPSERGDSSAVGRGRDGRPDHDQQHCYHHAPTVKPEAATAVVELLMMGVRAPETFIWIVWWCKDLQTLN